MEAMERADSSFVGGDVVSPTRRGVNQRLQDRVAAASAAQGLSTAEIVELVSADHEQVYRDLVWLREYGCVTSETRESKKLLLFCIRCRLVLTHRNFNKRCKPVGLPPDERHEVRGFHPKESVWWLTAFGHSWIRDSSQQLAA